MVADEALIRRSLAILESTGQYIDPEMLTVSYEPTGVASVTPTCFSVLSAIFGRAPGPANEAIAVPTKEVGAAAPKKKANRLEQANEALQSRVDTLHERAASQRVAASAAFKVGDKRAALLALKRAKATEAAAESAGRAQMALETQIDVMEQASVQAAVSTALSSAVKQSQKSGRGLLQRVERAQDGAAEMMDLSQDVAATLSEMAPGANEDEDDLMQELERMMGEKEHASPPVPANAVAVPTNPSIGAAVLAQLPKAPKGLVAAGSVLLGA